jgi:hypothetical protein
VSYAHINYVRDHSKMKGAPLLILSMIASRADEEGIAWPNLDTLARDTRMSKRNVIRALKLVPVDELEIITKGGSPKGGKREKSLYRIPIKTGDTTTPVKSSLGPVTGDATTPVEHSDGCPTVTSTGDNFDTTGDKNGKRPVSYGHPNSHITVKRTVSEQSKGADAPKRKARKLAGNVSALILPLFLDRPEFRRALEDWKVHKQAKRDPLTQRALELIVVDCERWGLERSIEYIHHAIKQGWKGIYEPKDHVASRPPKGISEADRIARQPESVRRALDEELNR